MLKGRGSMRLPLLFLHILAGSIGLLTGTFAMVVRKGGNLHRASGNVFTVAMLSLATSDFCLAILKSQGLATDVSGPQRNACPGSQSDSLSPSTWETIVAPSGSKRT
jgi:hypothetical protein